MHGLIDLVNAKFTSFNYNEYVCIRIKVDVHCFLLTDILLICKTTTKKGTGNLKVSDFELDDL